MALRLSIIDTELGQEEGSESQKILYFYPESTALSDQIAFTGLCEGLISFTRIFSPDFACDTLESDRNVFSFLQCERNKWMILAVEKATSTTPVSSVTTTFPPLEDGVPNSALLSHLRLLYVLLRYLQGPLSVSPPSSPSIPSNLRPRLSVFFQNILSEKNWKLPSLSKGLLDPFSPPLLPLPPSLTLSLQATLPLLQGSFPNNLSPHILLLHQGALIHSSLSQEDTVSAMVYAALRISPPMFPPVSSSLPSFSQALGLSRRVLNPPSPSPLHPHPWLSPSPQDTIQSGLLRPNPEAWSPSWSPCPSPFPSVYLEGPAGNGWHHLALWHLKSLSALFFLPCSHSGPSSSACCTALEFSTHLAKCSLHLEHLHSQLSSEAEGQLAAHVRGFRYLLRFPLAPPGNSASRASPAVKQATLTKESWMALGSLRAQRDLIQRERDHFQPGMRESNASLEISEMCGRTDGGAWVCDRSGAEGHLLVAMEKTAGKETLIQASKAVDSLQSLLSALPLSLSQKTSS